MPNIRCARAGLALAGRPVYLLAGQIHYFRYPRAEWSDILLKARAAGLNTVDTVIPWNLHEPRPGQFDFAGMANLPGYLDLCAELGLYVIVRPGPYICAEWENGGLPAWLGQEGDIAYRLDHPAYLEPLRRWFDRLIPLLVERQIDRAGPIILVQIENEHWASGVYGHDAHQVTLAQALQTRGITAPLYTCMGPGQWPEFRNGWTGIDKKLAQTGRIWPDNPLVVSELWSGWFDHWGGSRQTGKPPAALDRRLHELTAIGASGFSHWMWAGGTNFGFWGGRTVGGDAVYMTTSYDYDAPVSEYGGLTGKYFVARRHHLLLSTLGAKLASLLAEAQPGGPQVIPPKAIAGRAAGGGAPHRRVRRGDFTATYLDNDTLERQTYHLFLDPALPPPRSPLQATHLTIDVEPAALKPIFTNLPLTGSLTLRYHTGRLLGFWQLAPADVLAIYGFASERGELVLAGGSWTVVETGGTDCRAAGAELRIRYWLTDRPTVVKTVWTPPAAEKEAGDEEERLVLILLLTQDRAERCWPVGEQGFLIGPHYLQDYELNVNEEDGLTVRLDPRGLSPFYWIDAAGTRQIISPPALPEPGEAPRLTAWEALAVEEVTAETTWQALDRPHPFATLGCNLGYGWYRTVLEVTDQQETTIAGPGLADRGLLFVDGHYRGVLGVGPEGPTLALPLTLAAGAHELRLLVDNLGRFNYGSGLGERKGLLETLYRGGRQTDLTTGWVALWQEAYFAGEAIAGAKPAHIRPDAANVDLASFAFTGSDVWLLREFEVPAGRRALLYLTGDRNPGAMFVNGRVVARFSRHYGGGFHKYEVTDWLDPGGANVIALHIRDYAGLAWRATLLTYDPAQAIAGPWYFRPGVTPAVTSDRPSPNAEGRFPAFFRTHFSYDPDRHGSGPFKLSLPGLGKGHLWLNGRSLGRYWQIGPQEFYKVPVSWLAAENELLIFEELAGTPEAVRLEVDGLGRDQIAPLKIVC